MFVILGVIFLILWGVGFIGFHIAGWLIHILLVVAILMFLIRLIRGE